MHGSLGVVRCPTGVVARLAVRDRHHCTGEFIDDECESLPLAETQDIGGRGFPRYEWLKAKYRIVRDLIYLLSEGAEVIGDGLPVGIEVNRPLPFQKAHEQFRLPDLTSPIDRDTFRSVIAPPALECREFICPVKKHRPLSPPSLFV